MSASLSEVCLSPYYTVPTQTFRYIKHLPKNSIKLQQVLTFVSELTLPHHILWYTTLACQRHNIITSWSYSTLPTIWNPIPLPYIHIRSYLAKTTYSTHFQIQKYHTRFLRRSGTNWPFFSFFLSFFRQCGTVFYLVLYGAVRCIKVVTPGLSIDFWYQKAATF